MKTLKLILTAAAAIALAGCAGSYHSSEVGVGYVHGSDIRPGYHYQYYPRYYHHAPYYYNRSYYYHRW